MSFWTDDNRKKIVNCLFYVALTIELILMIVEKSELEFSLESYVFRVTFLLTLLAVLIMKHDYREWILIVVFLGIAGFCYVHSGKNDLLRLCTFLMAARDIDLRKAMKYCFYVCLVGFGLIALLSVVGVLGDISLVMDYGRENPEEKRYVFGFGHPNTLFGSVYALLLMWLWLYGETSKWWQYILVVVSSGAVVLLSQSRTGLLIVLLTVIIAAIFKLWPGASEKRNVYVWGALLSTVLSVVLSVLAAWKAARVYVDKVMSWDFWAFEEIINYRISNLFYGSENRDGVLYGWKLFAGHGTDSYFDIGWARLFYWYGIVPTTVIVLCVLAVVYVSWKKRDIWTLVLVISLSIYTLAEATFVTRYLGRDFFLVIAGVYLGYFFRTIILKFDTKEGETYGGKA